MPPHNPYDQQLLAALNEEAGARTAKNVNSIKGRARLVQARAALDSVKAAHRRWREENQD